jgi:P27 family predicted phage terminase small subunit
MPTPRTPTRLKLLRGNPGKQRLPVNEPMPQIAASCPEPPAFVTGHAADQWWIAAPELHRLGLLTVVDVPMLAAFCQAYARMRVAEEALARMSDRDETMLHGLLIKTVDGATKRNPLTTVIELAVKDMLACGSQLGMTPAARSRIAVGVSPKPPGKFDGLLA